jgi:AcrR family transcriptional regulator
VELFTTRGYATTSTRAIADAVGIRQSSLYHHFATKDDILEAILAGTVTGSLAFARDVLSGRSAVEGRAAAVSLYAVALFDGAQLCSGRWNAGVLYHVPEARNERFTAFAEARQELRGLYRTFGEDAVPSVLWSGDPRQHGELAFRLVESLISLRVDGQVTRASPEQVADAALVLCGFGDMLGGIRRDGRALIRILGRELPTDYPDVRAELLPASVVAG